MTNSLIQPSFAGGELSPKLYGRVDTAKYRFGLRKLLNFFIHPAGGASNRAGTQFVGEVRDSAVRGRLVPFQFNGQVTYVEEFGEQAMRVIKNGGFVLDDDGNKYEIETPYAAAALPLLKFTQSADVMTFCHPNYQPQDLGRTGDAAWTFTPVTFAPQVERPTGLKLTVKTSGSTTYRYKVTAVNPDDTEESLPGLAETAETIIGATNTNPVVLTITATTRVNGDEIYIDNMEGMTELNGRSFIVANKTTDTIELRSLDNSDIDGRTFGAYSSGGKATPAFIKTTAAAALSATNTIEVGWNAQQGVSKFNIYRELSGTFGYLGSSNSTSYVDDNAIKPDTGDTPPSGRNPFEGENYPSTVAYYDQRKFFANSIKQPQTFWATQTGNFKNMNVSSPTKADDAITRTLVASQVNAIKHMVSMNVLIMFTSGAEWKCWAGANSDSIAPDACFTKPQSYNGCSDVPPIVANSSILFVQEKGSIVRDLGYEFASDSYTGTDRSVWSDHLFYGHKIVEWAYAQEPFRIIWAIRDDGVLLGFTYMKEQDVYAWHRHTTDGFFESVAVISENGEDVPYFIVRREINGETKRYVERMHTRQFADVSGAWFLDCALQYDGDPTDVVTGLDHLEGKTVGILGDGNVFPQQVVAGGRVKLDSKASKITIGLPYTAEMETLDLDAGDPTIQGKRKKLSAVTVKVENTRGLKIGGVYENGQYSRLTEVKERTNQMYGTPIGLLTGQERVILDPTWNTNGRILIRQENPLPCTVLAAIPEVDLGN